MSPSGEIRFLNTLNAQFAYNSQVLWDIDDLMPMAECRFFSAIMAIHEETSQSEKKLMQQLLKQELVSTSYPQRNVIIT